MSVNSDVVDDYPFQWVPLTEEQLARRRKAFHLENHCEPVFRSVPGDLYMPEMFQEIAREVYNFKLRDDDVWILTYPKCGTTMTQEVMWLAANGGDVDSATSMELHTKSPFLEFPTLSYVLMEDRRELHDQGQLGDVLRKKVADLEQMPSPRIIKAHLPLEHLPTKLLDTCKVIFVGRGPKDTCVSYYHFQNLMFDIHGFFGDFDDFCEFFERGELVYGSYWITLKSAWAKRDHPNLKMFWFEDVKSDIKKYFEDLCEFTGYTLTADQLARSVEHMNIETQRKNAATNAPTELKNQWSGLFRKGDVGDWRNHFMDPEKVEKWDKWIEENKAGTGIQLPE